MPPSVGGINYARRTLLAGGADRIGVAMRVLRMAVAAILLIAGAAALEPAAATTLAPTVRIVVRPVTSTGHVRSGFTLTYEPSGSVDCSLAEPSPGAVNKNIEFCSPSAEYAVACWKAAALHRVLCMRNPRSKTVVRIPRTGAFAPTGLAPVAQRAPLVMRLGDGDVCSIRDGGAWGSLPGHPNLSGTYSCAHDGAVWATSTAAHLGVNESNPVWTVRTAHFGSSTLVTRHVVKAWFVGTYFG
jgi:hypothetical protein